MKTFHAKSEKFEIEQTDCSDKELNKLIRLSKVMADHYGYTETQIKRGRVEQVRIPAKMDVKIF